MKPIDHAVNFVKSVVLADFLDVSSAAYGPEDKVTLFNFAVIPAGESEISTSRLVEDLVGVTASDDDCDYDSAKGTLSDVLPDYDVTVIKEIGEDYFLDIVAELDRFGLGEARIGVKSGEEVETIVVIIDEDSFTAPLSTLHAYKASTYCREDIFLTGGTPPITCNYTGYYGKQGLAEVYDGVVKKLYFPFLPDVIPVSVARGSRRG